MGELRFDDVDLLFICGGIEHAARQLEAQVDQIGVQDVDLAVVANRGDLAAAIRRPHLRSADQPKIAINVSYKDDEKFALQAKVLRDMGLLEAFAAHAADRYVWPNPFSIVARSCGVPNATWNIGAKTLTLCYELANEFIELYDDYSRQLPKKFQAAR